MLLNNIVKDKGTDLFNNGFSLNLSVYTNLVLLGEFK
jgi:hypothetical protein